MRTVQRWIIASSMATTSFLGCTGDPTISEGASPASLELNPERHDRSARPSRDHRASVAPTEERRRECGATTKLDVLFVIDNSNSMLEEQEKLALQLPRMVEVMATGDLDGDGAADVPAVTDLQVGIVTTDMGTGDAVVPTCFRPLGDDGVLRTRGNIDVPGCEATYPPYQALASGGDPASFASDVACVARTGIGGCGFEQQLESLLKAVTPTRSPIRFFDGTLGHGDGANAGFVREDAMLAVVVVTDEDDCSARDPELFEPSSPRYTGDLNLRCVNYETALEHVRRYVRGLRAVKDDLEDRIVFSVIGGVPVDLIGDPTDVDFNAILDDERMQNRVDPGAPVPSLTPACTSSDGIAFPARRLLGAARLFEHNVVGSICAEDYGAYAAAITSKVLRRMAIGCD